MRKKLTAILSLLCLTSGVLADDVADLSSLVFARTPVTSRPAPAAPAADRGPAGGAGTADTETLDAAAATLERSIEDREAAGAGRTDEQLAELVSLAAVYRELGEELPAIAALERARQISRISEGLHSLDQAWIVEQMIDAAEAVGAYGESDALQDQLLELAARNDEDPRAPSVLIAVAERQMDAVGNYLETGIWRRGREPLDAAEGSGWEPSTSKAGRHKAGTRLGQIANLYDEAIEDALTIDDYALGEPLGVDVGLDEIYALIDVGNDFAEEGILPRGITVPTSLSWSNAVPPSGSSGASRWEPAAPASDREWALQSFRRARRLLSAAMQTALSQGSQAEYLALEELFVDAYYFEIANPDLHPPSCYVTCSRGRHPERAATLLNLLQARVVERLHRGASAADVASAMLELGDLYPNKSALDKYRLAHDFVVARNVSDATVAALFSPALPAVRPAFVPDDFTDFDPARSWRGHVDVAVEIGRYGETKDVEMLDASPGTPDDVVRRLNRHVLRTAFRPRFVDGAPARSDRFTARYYYDY